MPLLGASPAPQFCTILVRPRAGQRAETLGPALSKAVAELDSNLPTYFAGTPARFHNEILSGNRIIAMLFTIFGIVAFILSAVGLYGVMSFSVNQRTQEFGIRMALGADAARIFRMVMTARRVATHHRACSRRRRDRLASGSRRSGGVEKHFVQSQRAGSDDLFRGGRNADVGCRRFLLRSCAPRHTCRPDSSITHRVI